MNYEIIKFKDGDFELDVNVLLSDSSVWLSQKEMSLLFGKSQGTIANHIRNIFKEKIFEKGLVYSKIKYTGRDGKNYQVGYYKLELIIALGYRTNSPRIEKFRLWASSLKNDFKDYKNINYIDNDYEIVKFTDGEFELDVNVSPFKNDVYLSQKQMAELFEVTTDNIGLHIKNILKEEEFDTPVSEESSVTASDGKTYKITIYNLDMIFAVGTRVKSRRGILFRKWAFKILKQMNLDEEVFI